ncbi:MAG: ABC transporter substrate-binding protein [Acidimicrobiia bacterium]|nr:ABC transporter substrate-binding protein [Acidimicrobiia bacterium]
MRIRSLAPLLVIALASTAVGCGDESEGSSSGTTGTTAPSGSTSSTAPAVEFTGDPIVLGATTSTDALIPPSLGGVEEGTTAAAATLNAAGGVTTADGLTHEVAIVYCNNKNDKAQTADCARRFVDEGVAAVVGSAAIFPEELVPILQEAGIAYFSPTLASLGLVEMTTPNSFVIFGTPVFFIGAALELAKAGYEETAVIFVTSGGTVLPAVQAALESQGGSMAKTVEVPAANPNWPQLAAEAADGTDSIMMIMDEETVTPFVAALRQIGKEVAIGGPAIAITNETLATTGGADSPLVGARAAGPWAMPEHESWADYRESMAEHAPGTQLEGVSQNAWLSVVALASVISQIEGPVDSASVMGQLSRTTDLGSFGGKLPDGIDLTRSDSEVLNRLFDPYYWGPIEVTADGLVDAEDAAFQNGLDILLEALNL